MPMTIEERFYACAQVTDRNGCPKNIYDGLELYGLFNQATRGDINKTKPSALNLREKAKWDAWNKHKGIPSQEAMEKYIHQVHKAYSSTC